MKKNYLLAALALVSMLGHAEKHELGDYVEIDGMPSIVVYVDETGEHGLLMSPQALGIYETDLPKIEKQKAQSIKDSKSQLKKRYKFYFAKRAAIKGADAVQHIDSMYAFQQEFIDKYYNLNRVVYTNARKNIKKEEWDKIYGDIRAKMAGSGEDNTKTIVDYCAKNNLPLQDYFPTFYWATQIGKGWFIPGNDELELLMHSCGFDSVGVTHPVMFTDRKTKGTWDLYDKFDEDRPDFVKLLSKATMGIDYYWFSLIGGVGFWPICVVQSSTLVASDWSKNIDNLHKAVYYNSSTTTTQIFTSSLETTTQAIKQAERVDFESNRFYSTGLWTAKDHMVMYFYVDSDGYTFAMHRF